MVPQSYACCVIMAGGKGERFWPLSKEKLPKPFLNLFGDKTMIQQTVERVIPIIPHERIFVVLGKKHLEVARNQLPELDAANFIVEPMGKDTAACIGFASLFIEKVCCDSIMVVLAADHYIPDRRKFHEAIELGINVATRSDSLITLGIKPTRPETGYGYIEAGEVSGVSGLSGVANNSVVYEVKRFIEKPDFNTATRYLENERFYWNSGMFIWKNSVIQKNIREFLPDHWVILQKIKDALFRKAKKGVIAKAYEQFQRVSLDYGIMEKATNVLVIPGEFRWDDVGTWASLERVMNTDEDGNVVVGRHVGVDTQRCVIHSQSGLVVTIGISGMVIVEADGKVLICSKERNQDLKELLKQL